MIMFVWMVVFGSWKCVEVSDVCKGTKASCILGWATDLMQAGGLGSGNWSSPSSLCGHAHPASCNSVYWRLQGYSLPSTGTLFQFKSPSKDQEEIISIVTTCVFWRPDIQEDVIKPARYTTWWPYVTISCKVHIKTYSALRKYSAPLNFATFCHISGFKQTVKDTLHAYHTSWSRKFTYTLAK